MPVNFIQRLFGRKELPFPEGYFTSDKAFNRLYPPYIRQVAPKHFTSLGVAYKAATFLASEPGVKILDIGSGAGKFCLAAAHYMPQALYFGVELRKNLAEQAEFAKNTLQLTNVTFINSSFTQLDFTQYNHFYFYNSFYENIIDVGRIDDALPFNKQQFAEYNAQLFAKLDEMPAGTKLVTFHVAQTELPPSFKVTREDVEGFLKFCVKM